MIIQHTVSSSCKSAKYSLKCSATLCCKSSDKDSIILITKDTN